MSRLLGPIDNKFTNTYHIHIVRILGEERKEEIFQEIMAYNFLYLMKDEHLKSSINTNQGDFKDSHTNTH